MRFLILILELGGFFYTTFNSNGMRRLECDIKNPFSDIVFNNTFKLSITAINNNSKYCFSGIVFYT